MNLFKTERNERERFVGAFLPIENYKRLCLHSVAIGMSKSKILRSALANWLTTTLEDDLIKQVIQKARHDLKIREITSPDSIAKYKDKLYEELIMRGVDTIVAQRIRDEI